MLNIFGLSLVHLAHLETFPRIYPKDLPRLNGNFQVMCFMSDDCCSLGTNFSKEPMPC